MIKTIQEYAKIIMAEDIDGYENEMDAHATMFPIAVVMHHIMVADGIISEKERNLVVHYFQKEFALDEGETYALFDAVAELGEPLFTHLKSIRSKIDVKPAITASIFKHLNDLIICDGCEDSEYKVFEKARAVLT